MPSTKNPYLESTYKGIDQIMGRTSNSVVPPNRNPSVPLPPTFVDPVRFQWGRESALTKQDRQVPALPGWMNAAVKYVFPMMGVNLAPRPTNQFFEGLRSSGPYYDSYERMPNYQNLVALSRGLY